MIMNNSVFTLVVTAVTIILCQQPLAGSTQPTQNEATNLLLKQQSFPCPPWYVYQNENSLDPKSCQVKQCLEPDILPKELKCINGKGAQVEFGYCMTYDENKHTFEFGSCHYFQSKQSHNITERGRVILPDNVSELNSYMCGLMNRKGPLCSQCIDGFGPALTSIGFTCSDCTNAWYGVPLYLIVEFVPITILYFVILTFQINITSAPVTCFILYCQILFFELQYDRRPPVGRAIYQLQGTKLSTLIMVYGAMNLEIVRFIVPPFCISSKLQFIHISILEYLPAFYPLFLILLTWLCIELHDRNFRPLVWAWRPFHKWFVRLRRGWNTRSDLVDVFASFFLLSYSKIAYHSLILIDCQPNFIFHYGNVSSAHNTYYDPSKPCSGKEHIGLSILAAVFLGIFNILPTFLLILYPIKVFRVCLSKCRLDGIAVTTFVNKFHGCYRDGLDGGRDMRSLSGLYFFTRIIIIFVRLTMHLFIPNIWLSYTLLYSSIALFIAYVKPYKKAYMNFLDTILLANLSVVCLLMSSEYFKTQAIKTYILLLLPIVLVTLLVITKLIRKKLLKNDSESFKQKVKILLNGFYRKVHKTIASDCPEQPPSPSTTSSYYDNDRTPLLMHAH